MLLDAEFEEKSRLLDAKFEKIMQLTSKQNGTHDGSPNPSPGMRKSSCGSVPCLDEFDGIHVSKFIHTYIYAYILTDI